LKKHIRLLLKGYLELVVQCCYLPTDTHMFLYYNLFFNFSIQSLDFRKYIIFVRYSVLHVLLLI